MAKKKQVYRVVKGCTAANGKEYKPGEPYDPADHKESTTKEFLDSGAITAEDN